MAQVDAIGPSQLLEKLPVVVESTTTADRLEVLRGRAHHRRAADVDVLDRLIESGALRHLVLEGIEIHHHHVDGNEAGLLEIGEVLLVPPRQDAPEHLRMEGFHPAAENLREPGDIADRGHGNARLGQCGRGSPGGEDLEAEGDEALAEIHDAFLAVDGDEGALLL